MRGLVAVVVAVISWSAIAEADKKAANAANTRGYALHKKKKYAEAAVEYRKAIAADPAHLLAHYNLACIGSLTKDQDTARAQLMWIADRATWDPAAEAVLMKTAPKDKDLAWIRKLDWEGEKLAGGMEGWTFYARDLLDESAEPSSTAKPTTDAAFLKAMGSASGKHEAACSAETFAATSTSLKANTVGINLRDGLVLVDDKGAVLARSEPLGCTKPRERVEAVIQASAVGGITAMFVVQYTNRTEQKAAMFALMPDKKFVRVFDAEVMGYEGTGTLVQTSILYNIVFTPAGTSKPIVYRWDSASTKYVPESP